MSGKAGNFSLWNLKSWALESGIQLKGSRIPITIGIKNPPSTHKGWNPVPGIRNPWFGIRNPRLSQIPLHVATFSLGRVFALSLVLKVRPYRNRRNRTNH